jgi:hypothetical protein
MSAWTFHHAAIGGLAFEGLISADGPSIACKPSRDPLSGGGVALMASGLRRFAPERVGRAAKPEGWWIVKYRDEERIFLPGFTPADIECMTRSSASSPSAPRNGAAPVRSCARERGPAWSSGWRGTRGWPCEPLVGMPTCPAGLNKPASRQQARSGNGPLEIPGSV